MYSLQLLFFYLLSSWGQRKLDISPCVSRADTILHLVVTKPSLCCPKNIIIIGVTNTMYMLHVAAVYNDFVNINN